MALEYVLQGYVDSFCILVRITSRFTLEKYVRLLRCVDQATQFYFEKLRNLI